MTDKTSGHVQTQQVTYAYDAFNRRVKRTFQEASADPVATGFFVHDGNQIAFELENDGDVAHRLLWGPAVDMALTDETGGGTTSWYFADHLGSVRDVATYNSGTNVTSVANHIAFDGFGQHTSETNGAHGDFDLGFTGKWLDRDTGLQWNQNRWYNAAIGRWMSEDPIGFASGDVNLARYALNSPVRASDPDGLETKDRLEIPARKKVGVVPLVRDLPASSFNLELSNVTTEIRIRIKDKCEGGTSKEFLETLNFAKRWGSPLESLTVKGHGVQDYGIIDDKGRWLIVVDEKSGRIFSGGAWDGDGFGVDITDQLIAIVDSGSSISLRGCKTSNAAKQLSAIIAKSVKGVSVTGYRGIGTSEYQLPFTVNIPFSDSVIGIPVTYMDGN